MSQLEVATNSSPSYAVTFPAMIAGTVNNAVAIPNFNGATSKILGCVRVTVGGTVGQPYAHVQSGLSTFPTVFLRSGNALDTSVYQLFWINEVAESQIATVLAC